MDEIHPASIVSKSAIIGKNVSIGPFAVIGAAVIGDGSIIHAHVILSDGVEIGSNVEVFPGAFIGREPKGAGATSRRPEFDRQVRIGGGCSIGPNAIIYYDVAIGENTLIGDGASIREKCTIGSRCIISRYVTINYATRIGDQVKVMDLTHLTGNMVIGDDAFVSTMVGTANDNRIQQGYGGHCVGPTIEAGAIIGAGATLLPAVIIGNNAIVAAGSVVSKDVAPGDQVMGVPARSKGKPATTS
jgi:UDP-3-O-[3-hydroxymyristoyl] glucosamine N-acyltransferase